MESSKMKQTKLAPARKYAKGDIRSKFKKGDLIAHKYAWPKEPTKTYVFRVTKFPTPKGKILYAKLVKARENNGKWIKQGDPSDHFNWGEQAFWDFNFTLGKVNPTHGTGKAYRFRGK